MRKLGCVICGKPASFDTFCKEHYSERHSLFSIPKSVEVEFCRRCESPFQGKDKISMSEAIKKNIETHGDVKKLDYDIKNNKITITAKGTVGKIDKEETHEADFRLRRRMCEECQKRSGGYFESTVQIRPKYEWALDKLNNIDEIVNVEEKREGYDINMINKASANKVVARLAKWVIERKDTRKLYGEKKGQALYRNTVLIRLRDKGSLKEDI